MFNLNLPYIPRNDSEGNTTTLSNFGIDTTNDISSPNIRNLNQ